MVLLAMMGLGELMLFGFGLKDPLQYALESYHLEDLFYYLNRTKFADQAHPVSDQFVLVDIANIRDRDSIADLLDSISRYEPRAVALDVIFGARQGSESKTDRHLMEAATQCPNLILTSNCYTDYIGSVHIERSFFADSIQAAEGLSWLQGEVVRTYSAYYLTPSGTQPSLCYQMAEALGLPMDTTTEERNINYAYDGWMTWQAGVEDMDLNYLRGKLVLIGDTKDLVDYHNVPMLTCGTMRKSGVEIHAAILSSVATHRSIHRFSLWGTWLMEILCLFLLCLLFTYLPQVMTNWLQQLVQLLVMALVFALAYWLFATWDYVLPISRLLIGTGLAGFAYDVVEAIYTAINNAKK